MIEILANDNSLMLIKWGIITVLWLFLSSKVEKDKWQIYGVISLILLNFAINDLRGFIPKPMPEVISQPAQISQTVVPANVGSAIAKIEDSKITLPPTSKVPFSNISEFNEANSKQQAYVDWLKERYETWLITYYYLQKCNKVSDKDLPIITESLLKELDTVHADKSIKDGIILAANGSYSEMYSNIPCDDSHVKDSKASYDANMQQIKTLKEPIKEEVKKP